MMMMMMVVVVVVVVMVAVHHSSLNVVLADISRLMFYHSATTEFVVLKHSWPSIMFPLQHVNRCHNDDMLAAYGTVMKRC